MLKYLIIALVILVSLLMAGMYLFAYLAKKYRSHQSRKKLDAINDASPYRKNKINPKPNNDFLAKDKIREKKKQDEREVDDQQYQSAGNDLVKRSSDVIVGITKPIGLWTKFIAGQKLGFMVAMGALQGNKMSYWVNVLKAQQASQGKSQGRGK